MSDVFILGAGFSRAVAQEMPLLADLSAAVWSKVPEEKVFLHSFWWEHRDGANVP